MAAEKKSRKLKNEVVEPDVCTVCSERYTSIIRKKISCKFCKESTCSKCIEQYLLTRHEDAHCLHCRVNYNDTTLHEICTQTYLKQTYFKHRQEVLINRERANLPPLQEEASREKKIKAFNDEYLKVGKEINQLRKKYDNIHNEYNDKYAQVYVNYIDNETKRRGVEELEKVKARRDNMVQSITKLQDEQMSINHRRHEVLRQNRPNSSEEDKDEKRKFIRRCTRTDCQGFLSTAWKCGLCDWYSCNKCFAVKGEEHDTPHECKKEDIETAELIKKDCKPCPKCGEFIEKSSGCSQMFCISCQTPWDWNTGRIVTTGAIHNPHYYEWLKRTGGTIQRNPADVPCGGYPTWRDIQWVMGIPASNYDTLAQRTFNEFHRLCMEIQDNSARHWRSHVDNATMNRINIRYLIGEFDDKTWGRQLATHEKKRKRDSEIQDVLAAFRMVAVELINRVYQFQHDGKPPRAMPQSEQYRVKELLEQVNREALELISVINDGLRTVSMSYSYTVPYISSIKMDNRRYNGTYDGYYIHLSLESRNFREHEKIERNAKKSESLSNDQVDDSSSDVSDDESVVDEVPRYQAPNQPYTTNANNVRIIDEVVDEVDEFADDMTMNEQEQLQAAILESYVASNQ
jgi:hypothetical protein